MVSRYSVKFQDCVEESNHDPLSAPTQTPPSVVGDIKIDKKPSENVSLNDNSLLVSTYFLRQQSRRTHSPSPDGKWLWLL